MAKARPTKKSAAKKSPPDQDSSLRMMNALPDPVVAFDSMLKVVLSNRAAQEFFKLDKKQMLDKYMVELLGSKNDVFESVEEAVRKNVTITLHDVSVDGRPVSSVIISVADDGLYLMIIRQRPAMQLTNKWSEQTLHSIKLARDIEKPVAEISRAAKILTQSPLGGKDRKLAEQIVQETSKIQGLLEKFNILYDAQREQHKAVSLRDVVNSATRIAQETYGNKIEIKEFLDPLLPDIRGNFDHLVQAKLNLIKNAAEAFANAQGKISIRTFYDAAAAAAPPDGSVKRPLCIEIEDNGRGINPDVINRIFQPYFTTKPSGQGLGLPVASQIVYDHGGTINVDSQPGKTVFRINLPLPTNPANPLNPLNPMKK